MAADVQSSSGETLSELTGRWFLGIEVALILQAAAFWLFIRSGLTTNLANAAINIGLLVLLAPLATALIAMSVWRDTRLMRGHTNWSPNSWMWMLTGVFLPVIGGTLYILARYRNPSHLRHGISGTIVAFGSWIRSRVREELPTQAVVDDPVSADVDEEKPGQLTEPVIDDALRQQLPTVDVLGHVAKGGSADVYRVRFVDEDQPAALKVPRYQGTISTPLFEKFVDEAETWSQLDDHTNIVDLLGHGTKPYPWLLLEYMDRGSLADRIPLSPGETARVLTGVANGLHYAHRHGIAHRDLKPENVLFGTVDEEEVVKIGDWGISRHLLDDEVGSSGLTLPYAGPEQLASNSYGTPDDYTDIFQLGIITYEALTGQVPFDNDERSATVQAILSDRPTPPSNVNPEVPAEADEVVLQAMAKRKEDRYESVLYFRDALTAALD